MDKKIYVMGFAPLTVLARVRTPCAVFGCPTGHDSGVVFEC